jgi:hypothetical protein
MRKLALPLLSLLALSPCAYTQGAKAVAVPGSLLSSTNKNEWAPLAPGAVVPNGRMLVALPEATLESTNGAVGIELLADLGKRGPFPVLESALRVLDAPAGIDAEVQVDRGIVVFTNRKISGTAKVKVHVAEQEWSLNLREPGTTVGIEIYGRQSPGAIHLGKIIKDGFKTDKDVPNLEVILLVLKGQVFVELGSKGMLLRAPPGPARMHWNNLSKSADVDSLPALPEGLTKAPDAKETELREALNKAFGMLAKESPQKSLEAMLTTKDPRPQRIAVTALAALDDVAPVLRTLETSTNPEVREQSVLVLRHWLGRQTGQVQKLHHVLTNDLKFSPVKARIVLQLLVGFDEHERRQPELYQFLIGLLMHKDQAVRDLAYWHLSRLAPAGASIGYDPAAPAPQRQDAHAKWLALIPSGSMPPAPDKK